MNLRELVANSYKINIDLPKQNLNRKATTKSREIPIQCHGRVGAAILQLHSKLPAKQGRHEDSQKDPCDSGKLGSANALEIKEPSPENVGSSSSNTRSQRSQSSRSHGKVVNEVNTKIRAVPVEADENRDEKIELLSPQEGSPFLGLIFDALVGLGVGESRAV